MPATEKVVAVRRPALLSPAPANDPDDGHQVCGVRCHRGHPAPERRPRRRHRMHRTARATVFVPIAVFVLTAGPAAAQPGGTLTAGSATYVQQAGPTGESLASPTGVVFRPEAAPPSQLFQN